MGWLKLDELLSSFFRRLQVSSLLMALFILNAEEKSASVDQRKLQKSRCYSY